MAQFTEVSRELGIDHLYTAPTYMGGGVAFADFNNDGLDDLYLPRGRGRDQLFLNRGDGNFLELSGDFGLEVTEDRYSFGAVAGDINNDGCRDIFITTYYETPNFLLLNNCDSTFTDISAKAGITHGVSSTAATFIDYNLDGFLDIYVVNYVEESDFTKDENGNVNGFAHRCFPNFLYLNNGNNTFSEEANPLKVDDPGCGLAVASTDFDLDHDTDVYVGNDFGEYVLPNVMYSNRSDAGNFYDVSAETQTGVALFAMGIATADYDLDGDFDYYITNIGHNVLLNNNGELGFNDVSTQAGVESALAPNGKNSTGWGTFFFDYDNDAYSDLFVSNGFVPALDFLQTTPEDPNRLFKNQGDGTFKDVTNEFGLGNTAINRGTAFSDFDNDGDLDFFVATLNNTDLIGHSFLYLNENQNANHWIKVKLEGASSNRDAIGSKVFFYLGEKILLREVEGGSSHASQNSLTIHAGLGNNSGIDSIAVFWPGGYTQIFYNINADQTLFLREGDEQLMVAGCMNPQSDHYDPSATYNMGCTYCRNWYFDGDKDGLGDPNNYNFSCDPLSGHVLDNTDCNDTDSNIGNPEKWYPDRDGDGYGDATTVMVQCEKPDEYVANDFDCDDSDPLFNLDTFWYADNDGDGFGDPNSSQTACKKPGGFVANQEDCDDNDPEVNEIRTWFLDGDSDGFGNQHISQLACKMPPRYVNNQNDCDDEDPNVYPGSPAKPDGKDNDCDGKIDKIDQILTFNPIQDKTFGDVPFTLTATSTSGLEVNYKVIEGPGVIKSNQLTLMRAGRITVAAYQPGNEAYNPAKELIQSFCSNPVTPVITINSGIRTLLSSSHDQGNQWFYNEEPIPEANTKAIEVIFPGVYQVTVEINGCVSESDLVEIIITGIENEDPDNSFKVFPNPARNEITFDLDRKNSGRNLRLSIYDLNGHWVGGKDFSLVKRNFRLEYGVGYLQEGIYLFIISGGNVIYKGRFRKE